MREPTEANGGVKYDDLLVREAIFSQWRERAARTRGPPPPLATTSCSDQLPRQQVMSQLLVLILSIQETFCCLERCPGNDDCRRPLGGMLKPRPPARALSLALQCVSVSARTQEVTSPPLCKHALGAGKRVSTQTKRPCLQRGGGAGRGHAHSGGLSELPLI